MNTIQIISTQPWVKQLGSTLLHFLWEGVSIAAVYAVVRRWAERRSGPTARYIMACVALASMAAAPVVTWVLVGVPSAESVSASFTAPASAAAPRAGQGVALSISGGLHGTSTDSLLPWVVAAWLLGALAFWVRMLGGWLLTQRLRSRMVRHATNEWQQVLNRLKVRLRVSRPVELLVSSIVQVPVVVGWLRPAVLVPVGALAGLPASQIEALLLHEMAHIRRHDYLVNVLQNAVEAILFYHPGVWWISGHIRIERELCCDDVAVATSGDVVTYARALAGLESARPAGVGIVLAANGGSLANRIARLAGRSRPAAHPVSGSGIILAAAFLAISALTLLGQTPVRPMFEVASIKPGVGQGFMMVRPLPGRLTANASLQMLMQNAYDMQSFQIAGGPSWVNSERFAIEARADGNATRDQIILMLQSLLEDRYQMKFHRETRELPVYALVVAKGGVRLTSPKEGACVEPTRDTSTDWAGGSRMAPAQDGPPLPASCGTLRVMLGIPGAEMQGGKISMTALARSLSLVTGRLVIDRTGFTGLSDIKLTFLPDDITAAMPPPPPAAPALEMKVPSILTALQEQLGLRLESTRGPVDVIAIDHAERPSNN